jgi:hypothetical protein
MFYTETHRSRLYLGDTHVQRGLWAHVFVDARLSHAQPSVERPDATAETVDHRQIASFDSFGASFSLIRRGGGFDPVTMTDGMADDNAWITFGQVPERERRIVQGDNSPVSRDDRILIQSAWRRHHLNDMQAGCVHMRDMIVPETHDEKDDQVYQIKHWVCPVTGYRYGSAWLVSELPDAMLTRLKGVLTPVTR